MAVARKQVGEMFMYRGYEIRARFLGPDLLCEVDGDPLPGFYTSVAGVHKAGARYVDDKIEANAKRK